MIFQTAPAIFRRT